MFLAIKERRTVSCGGTYLFIGSARERKTEKTLVIIVLIGEKK